MILKQKGGQTWGLGGNGTIMILEKRDGQIWHLGGKGPGLNWAISDGQTCHLGVNAGQTCRHGARGLQMKKNGQICHRGANVETAKKIRLRKQHR